MKVRNHGSNIYSTYRCTGNKNNMLRMELSAINHEMIDVFILESNLPIVRNFSKRDVLYQAKLGLEDFVRENNVDLYIKSIWFVDSDSNPVEIYRLLTYEILKAVSNDMTVLIT